MKIVIIFANFKVKCILKVQFANITLQSNYDNIVELLIYPVLKFSYP